MDTCGRVNLSGPRFQALAKSDDRLTRTVLENYRIWAKKKRIDELTSSTILFDTVAVYLAASDRSLVKMQELRITVADGGFTRVDPHCAPMSVAIDWTNLDGYRDLLVKLLAKSP